MEISFTVIDKNEISGNVAFIVNYHAGGGSCKQTWRKQLYPLVLKEFGEKIPIFVTHKSGDATGIARQLVEMGVKTIAVVGGDGTLHEVIQGYMEAHGVQNQVAVHIFRAGTGNDFHDHLHPKCGSIETCLHRFLKNVLELHDVGLIKYKTRDYADGQRYFVNFAAVGLSATTIKQLSIHGKNRCIPRSLIYAVYGLAQSRKYSRIPISMTIMGEIECESGREKVVRYQENYNEDLATDIPDTPIKLDVYELVIGNGSQYGGGMRMTPSADSHDQILDISVFHKATTWDFIQDYPHVSKGNILQRKDKYFGFRCHGGVHLASLSTDITQRNTSPIQVDGEYVGYLPATATLIPHGVRFIV